jgi:hypothetical protein
LALFAVVGLANAFYEPTAHRTIYLTFAVFIAAGIVSVSKWIMWHGGGSYGPRLLAEIQPFLLLASIPVFKTIFEERRSKFGVFGFFILFAWSSATQVLGAYSPTDWNWFPKNVDQAPDRLWDWGDNPMSRSLQKIKYTLWRRGPLFMLPPKEVASVTGQRSMLVAVDGKAATVSFGPEWYGLESKKFGSKTWRWSPGTATVTIENPHAFLVEAKLDFSIRSLTPRTLSVVLGGREIWQGMLTPQTIKVTVPTLYLEPGENQLQFVTPDTAASSGNGDTRRLAFRMQSMCLELRDSKH